MKGMVFFCGFFVHLLSLNIRLSVLSQGWQPLPCAGGVYDEKECDVSFGVGNGVGSRM